MKVLFVTWAGGGNSTPVLGLATRLMARGHDVKVVSPDDQTSRFAAAAVPYGVVDRSPGQVLAAIERERPRVVVVDFMMPTWMSEAEASGVPWIALVHTLYDRVAAGILTAFLSIEAINDARVALGLAAVEDASAIFETAASVMVTAPAALDEASALPSNAAHVGAILEEAADDAAWVPPGGDGELVVVSLGTTFGLDEGPVVQRVLTALATLPVRVVVNVSQYLDAAALDVPDNAKVVPYVRHAVVLPHASLMVNHAGLGSIVAALSHGVPMVCVPLDRDQPHNAGRVAALGVGHVLTRDASVDAFRATVELALADDRCRAATIPFVDQYDPTASHPITLIESVPAPRAH